MSLVDAVKEHLRGFLGEPNGAVRIRGGVEVLRFANPAATDSWWLATAGMSSNVQVIPPSRQSISKEPRTELVMAADTEFVDVLSSLLLDLAEYPFRNGDLLHWWHVVPLGRPVVEGSLLTAAYTTFPSVMEKGFETLFVDAQRCDFLWVIPIAEAERQLFKSSGADALEDALEEAKVDFADLFRGAG